MKENKNAWIAVLLLLVFTFGSGTGGVTSKAPFTPLNGTVCCLVLDETEDRGSYTTDQLNVIDASDANSVKYLVETTFKGDFESLDVSTEPTKDLQWVQDAYKAAKATKDFKTPWVIAASKRGGFSTPLDTEEHIKQLLQPLGK